MNSKNKKIIKERMFTMNLKNKKIFSRIAAGVMTVAMAITLLPGTMKTVNAAGTPENPLESAQVKVILHKRANVYTPSTTFEFTVENLTKDVAKNDTNGGEDLTPEFKDALPGGVTADTITLSPEDDANELNSTSIERTLTFTFDKSKFTDIGTYRYKVQQKNIGYGGITYDTTEKYLDVIVARKGNQVYIENAFLIKKGTGREKIEKVVNTYGVKPDPVDPTDPVPDGTVNDLVISKNVTGNYGERDKEFSFEITINGATNESYNVVRLPEQSEQPEKKILELKSGGTQTITLHHGQKVKIYGLSKNDTYTIKEVEAKGYTSTYKTIKNDGSIVDGDESKTASGNIAEAIVGTGTSATESLLQTQEVAFTNDRTNAATGFALSYGPYALMVVLAGAVAFVLFRKRRAEY